MAGGDPSPIFGRPLAIIAGRGGCRAARTCDPAAT